MVVADMSANTNTGGGRPSPCKSEKAMVGTKAVTSVKTESLSLTASTQRSNVMCFMPSANILLQQCSSPAIRMLGSCEMCASTDAMTMLFSCEM